MTVELRLMRVSASMMNVSFGSKVRHAEKSIIHAMPKRKGKRTSGVDFGYRVMVSV
jgi:hypothetical protein